VKIKKSQKLLSLSRFSYKTEQHPKVLRIFFNNSLRYVNNEDKTPRLSVLLRSVCVRIQWAILIASDSSWESKEDNIQQQTTASSSIQQLEREDRIPRFECVYTARSQLAEYLSIHHREECADKGSENNKRSGFKKKAAIQ
jgi:hypothetical protein